MKNRTVIDLAKIGFAFAKGRATGTLSIPTAMLEEFIEIFGELLRDSKINIKAVGEPSIVKMMAFPVAGGAIGAGLGFLMGAIPGALAIGAIGFGLGVCVASVQIEVRNQGNDEVIFCFSA